MDHQAATTTYAAERYLLGEMTEPERNAYEEHFFSCEECSEEVRTTSAFLENARTHLARTGQTSQAVVSAKPAPAPRWWAAVRPLFWPIPAGAAAAAALVVCIAAYQAIVLVPALRGDAQDAQRLQSAPWFFLSASRGETPVVLVSERDRMVGLTLSKSFDRPYAFYLCEIRDAGNRAVLLEVLRAPRDGDELQILVPAAGLASGVYTVAVAGVESPVNRAPLSEYARYQFTLRREESANVSPEGPP